jgi:hypothetical protein
MKVKGIGEVERPEKMGWEENGGRRRDANGNERKKREKQRSRGTF